MLDEACRKQNTYEQPHSNVNITAEVNWGQLQYFTLLLSWKCLQYWNSLIPLLGLTCAFSLLTFLLLLSVHLSDFVAGVPKGLMLYGSVRKLTFILELLEWDFVLMRESERKKNSLSDIVTVGIPFATNCAPETVLALDDIKRRSPYVAALLQVSILNGTDLKTIINYTGEQVSQRALIAAPLQKAPSCSTYSVFSSLGSWWELLICRVSVKKTTTLFPFVIGFWSLSWFAVKLNYWEGKCNLCKWFWE